MGSRPPPREPVVQIMNVPLHPGSRAEHQTLNHLSITGQPLVYLCLVLPGFGIAYMCFHYIEIFGLSLGPMKGAVPTATPHSTLHPARHGHMGHSHCQIDARYYGKSGVNIRHSDPPSWALLLVSLRGTLYCLLSCDLFYPASIFGHWSL